jgi:hypothetical protein
MNVGPHFYKKDYISYNIILLSLSLSFSLSLSLSLSLHTHILSKDHKNVKITPLQLGTN